MKEAKIKKPKKVTKPSKPPSAGQVQRYQHYISGTKLYDVIVYLDDNNIDYKDVEIGIEESYDDIPYHSNCYCDCCGDDANNCGHEIDCNCPYNRIILAITKKVDYQTLQIKYQKDMDAYNKYLKDLKIFNEANKEVKEAKVKQKLEKEKIALEKQLNEIYKKLHGVTNEEKTSS
jgi:hypothetical protein